jgi:LPXTG-motif cell wall-anchored protein
MSGGAGTDVSVSVSEATTQGFDNATGAFNVGGNRGTNWLIVGLIALAAFGLWLMKRKK